jgi:hypothetical protein
MHSGPDDPSDLSSRALSRLTDLNQIATSWRQQAEEYRALGEGAECEGTRQPYLRLAADYDDLARRAEEMLTAGRVWPNERMIEHDLGLLLV